MSDYGCIRVSSAEQTEYSRLITLREAVISEKNRLRAIQNSECGIRNAELKAEVINN